MKPIKGLRWWMIGLVLSGLVMNYLARNALAVAAPEVNKVLNITTQQYGYIVAAFQAAYMVMQPIAGYALDVLGTKLGFALFAAAWSVVCLLHSTAGGWLSLAAFRAMLGATEAAGFPSALRATSEWFPAKERSIATGWFNIGSSVGAVVAPPLVVWCILQGNWRFAFAVIGGLGLVWSVLWFALYRVPTKHPRLSAEEHDYIRAGQEAPDDSANAPKPSWGSIVSSQRFWGIAIPIALFCIGGFAHQTLSGALYTLTSDMFGRHEVGTAVGLAGMSGWLGGMLFSLAVGTLAVTIGYNPLFVALAVFDIIAAIVVWTMLNDGQAQPMPMQREGQRSAAGALGS
ncbi:MFS transporter [Ralstonia flaminis]|jgi:MFS family permease|uniref:Major facilitator superfamily (MFS) profile domain-containing protein n=1 Tax=Ralstonia flaminis TaxID=3058597 RepID=A0ABM9KAB0_9RALS|nr:MFS transporter [Ralstonia sp. LMG 18101]CAJ0819284.1 hypothetical protein LMG18101_03896 [Ralstonia sp. LMG 18101]